VSKFIRPLQERGKSITDACLGWQDAEKMLRDLANI
jgi:phospho-2-dehydro-3-deoxyheptonate aldolase